MRCIRPTILSILLALPVICPAGNGVLGSRDVAELLDIGRNSYGVPSKERARRMEQRYRRMVSPSIGLEVESLATDDVRLLLRVLAMIAFYDPEVDIADDMTRILGDLDRRGATRDEDRMRYIEFLVAARRLEDARRYENDHKTSRRPRIPSLDEQVARAMSARGALVLDADGTSLVPAVVGARDIEVVVVSSPLCSFSRHAMASIEADPGLRDVMSRHGRWLMPVEGNLHIESVRDWNATHPRMPMVYAYKESQWPFIGSWDTPTFYFLRGGRVVATHTGWRSDADIAVLRRHLQTLGALSVE